MKILVVTAPAVGHVNPLLPIARALVSRGHDVLWHTGRAFRAPVESTGARFVPLEEAHDPGDQSFTERFPERAGLTGLAGIKFDVKHLFIDEIPHQVADIERILATFPADLIVSDPGVMGVAAVHERGGPRWVTVGITPLPLPSRDLPPFGAGLPPVRSGRERLRAAGMQAAQKLLFRDVERHHQSVRAALGLPPSGRHVFEAGISPYLFLQSGTQAFEYHRSDLPAHVHFVGPLLSSGVSPARAEAWTDRANGRPMVLVTQGTVATASAELVGPTLQALRDEDVFVLAVSPTGEAGGPIPGNAAVEQFVPYDVVMPHVAAVVTNGGYGGVQQALSHGVPLVVAGATEDKPEVAARVEWFGAGINLRTGKPTVDQVRAAVRHVLDDPAFRAGARRIRDDYARHDAATEASDFIEELSLRLDVAPSY